MSKEFDAIDTQYGASHGTLQSYVAGFVLSIVLTLAAYFLVIGGLLSGGTLVLAIVGLGIIQLLVQLVFFLHLSTSSHARWNLIILFFTILIVAILAGGSLWIMNNLDYNMATASPESSNEGHIPQ